MSSLQELALHPSVIQALVAIGGLLFLLCSSGKVVENALDYADLNTENNDRSTKEGFIIGKAENILIFVLVLAGEVTALALIFAAQNITTREVDNELFPSFVLVGTIVNFTYSLLVSFLIVEIIGWL